jgi:hypothetical protein
MSRFVRSPIILLSLALLAVLGGFPAAAAPSRPLSRVEFLKKVDRALARRNAKDLAALADWSAWRKDGNPDPRSLQLALPPAPLERQKELNDREVLYQDGTGRTWRLVLQESAATPKAPKRWNLPILTRPCPQGMQRRPLDDAAPLPTPPPPTSWSPLECWPLPM